LGGVQRGTQPRVIDRRRERHRKLSTRVDDAGYRSRCGGPGLHEGQTRRRMLEQPTNHLSDVAARHTIDIPAP
jgi:hypothetical protein